MEAFTWIVATFTIYTHIFILQSCTMVIILVVTVVFFHESPMYLWNKHKFDEVKQIMDSFLDENFRNRKVWIIQTELISRQLQLDETFGIYKTQTLNLEDILKEIPEEDSDREESIQSSQNSEKLLAEYIKNQDRKETKLQKKRIDYIKFLCFSILSSCSLIPIQICIYELENIGLANISLTNTFLTISDFTANIIMIIIFDKLQRRKGLILFNSLAWLISILLFVVSLLWKSSGVRIFNMFLSSLFKPCVLLAFTFTNLFLGKYFHPFFS